MLRKLIAIAAVAVAALFVGPVAPAQADTNGCVTRAEYRKVKRGMTMGRVHRIFDTRGRVSSSSSFGGNRDQWRDYRVCRSWGNPRWSSLSVNFDDYLAPRTRPRGPMRVYGKSAYVSR